MTKSSTPKGRCKIRFRSLLLIGALCLWNPLKAENAEKRSIFIRQQEMVKVTGIVTDLGDGGALPGVTILNGQKKMTTTGADGTFSITVAKGSEISFHMIGYHAVKRTISGSLSNLKIQMKSSSSELHEVVVTALGIKREERALGYAVTKIDSTQLTNAVASNWTDALSGKVAGLNLIRNSGPAGSNKIILRGENNLTGDNEALVVIDGVVSANSTRRAQAPSGGVYGTSGDNLPADFGSGLNDLNPEDIESVTVLKGPGATALYGQRGANGAIIITTRSGNMKMKKPAITFTSNASWEEVNRGPDTQYEFGQGEDGTSYFSFGTSVDGPSTKATSSTFGAPFDGQYFFQYDPATKTTGTQRTLWRPYENPLHAFFQTGHELNNSLSVEGTYKKVALRFSGNYGDNTWIVPNTGLARGSASLSANAKVTKKLDINMKVMYNNRQSDNLPATGYGNQSLMYWFMFAQPNLDVNWYKDYWAPDKQYKEFMDLTSSYPEGPYAISEQYINTQRRNGILANIQASYKLAKGLSMMGRASIDKAGDRRTQKRPWNSAGSKFAQGSYRVQDIDMREINGDFLLRYETKIARKFNLTASFGGSMMRNDYYKDERRADGLTEPNVYTLDNAANPLIYVPDTARYRINSFYGLASLSYKSYLYLDMTLRRDWSSTLATPDRTDNVGFNYPSASLSFIASDYFKLPKSISLAKLRLSAAQVGSGGTVPYRTAYNYFLAASGIYPDSASQNPTTVPNANLKPLKTTTYEAGAEMRFFGGRLGFDIAVYQGNTTNQILGRKIDASSGYTTAIINAGKVENKGLEIALNGSPVSVRNGFRWDAGLTFSTNKNIIRELSDTSIVLRSGALGGGQVVAKVGGSMGDLYGLGYMRSPDGQIVFDEKSGYAKNGTDLMYLGNTMPKYKAGFSNTFSYKRFSLTTLFDLQAGAVAHSLTFSRMAALGKLKVTLPGRYNGITGKGVIQNADGSYRPNDVVATDLQNYYNSIYGSGQAEGSIFSTDFIKFREANLGYSFNPAVLRRLRLSKLTISAYGRNLFIWSHWPAFDPEFGTLSGTDIVTGFETGQLPSTRTYGLRLVVGI